MALPATHPALLGHLLNVSLTNYQVQEGETRSTLQTALPFKSQDFNAHHASCMLANLSFLSPSLPKQSSTQLKSFGEIDISDSGPQTPPMANSPSSNSLWHICPFAYLLIIISETSPTSFWASSTFVLASTEPLPFLHRSQAFIFWVFVPFHALFRCLSI